MNKCTMCQRGGPEAPFTKGFESLCDECDDIVTIVYGCGPFVEHTIAQAKVDVLVRSLIHWDRLDDTSKAARPGRSELIKTQLARLKSQEANSPYCQKRTLLAELDLIEARLHSIARTVVIGQVKSVTGHVDGLFAAFDRLRQAVRYIDTSEDRARRGLGPMRPVFKGD